MNKQEIIREILHQIEGVYDDTINSLEDKEIQHFISFVLLGIAESVHRFDSRKKVEKL